MIRLEFYLDCDLPGCEQSLHFDNLQPRDRNQVRVLELAYDTGWGYSKGGSWFCPDCVDVAKAAGIKVRTTEPMEGLEK